MQLSHPDPLECANIVKGAYVLCERKFMRKLNQFQTYLPAKVVILLPDFFTSQAGKFAVSYLPAEVVKVLLLHLNECDVQFEHRLQLYCWQLINQLILRVFDPNGSEKPPMNFINK